MKIFIFSLINYIAGFHLLPEFTDVEEIETLTLWLYKFYQYPVVYDSNYRLVYESWSKVNWSWKDFSKMDELRQAIQAKKAKLDKMVHQFEDLHIPEGIILIDSMFFAIDLVKMNVTKIAHEQNLLNESVKMTIK